MTEKHFSYSNGSHSGSVTVNDYRLSVTTRWCLAAPGDASRQTHLSVYAELPNIGGLEWVVCGEGLLAHSGEEWRALLSPDATDDECTLPLGEDGNIQIAHRGAAASRVTFSVSPANTAADISIPLSHCLVAFEELARQFDERARERLVAFEKEMEAKTSK